MNRKYIFILLLVLGILIVAGTALNNNNEQIDVLIVNGTIVSMDSHRTILEHGSIAIKNGKILAVEKMASPGSEPKAKEIGIRAVVGEGLLDFPTPNKKTSGEGLEYTEMLIKKYRNDPLITVAVAPHSPYTCSADLLKNARNLSDKYAVPLHIHVSETEQEFNDSMNNHGLTPFEYLDSLGFLRENVIAAHSVHLTANDIQ